MARRVGLGFWSGLASRSALVYRKARSCIKGGISADLSRTFKSTAMAASLTSLEGANASGGKAHLRRCGGCSTSFPLFFGIFATVPGLLLSSSASGLSICVCARVREREKRREGSGKQKCLNFDWMGDARVCLSVCECFGTFERHVTCDNKRVYCVSESSVLAESEPSK